MAKPDHVANLNRIAAALVHPRHQWTDEEISAYTQLAALLDAARRSQERDRRERMDELQMLAAARSPHRWDPTFREHLVKRVGHG